LIFFFFFLLLKGRGVEVNVFFFPQIYEKVEGGGGKRVHLGFSGNVFFIVEKLGRGSLRVIFFTNSLWDGGKGAPGGQHKRMLVHETTLNGCSNASP
jgi:hypothetical protein